MSPSDPRKSIEEAFVRYLDPELLDLRGEYLDRLEVEGFSFLEVHFAALPRRAGKDLLHGGRIAVGDGQVDLGALRICDLFAADLMSRLPPNEGLLKKLYFQGDAEERRMVLRALPFLEPGSEVIDLMIEALRTNDEVLFEAGNLDSDLAARVLEEDAFNRVVLKMAFMGQAVERLPGLDQRKNADLTATLLDFREEREAADRPVWLPTLEVAALAPNDATKPCIRADLAHELPARRAAAARAADLLGDASLLEDLQAARSRETEDDPRDSLDRAIASLT